MFKSKLFLVIATVTLLIIAMVVMQVMEMKEFMLF